MNKASTTCQITTLFAVPVSLVGGFDMRRLILCAAVVLCVVGQADGSIVNSSFSGTVSKINSTTPAVEDLAGLLDGSIFEGSKFKGSYSFDSAGLPTFAAPPFDTSFATYNNVGVVAATVGNYSLTGAIEIVMENDFGSLNVDAYSPRSDGPSSFTNGQDTFANTGWIWSLEDRDGSVFSSLDLPSSPPVLPEFESNQFLIRFEQNGTGEVVRIWGSIDTLEFSPIPEPSTFIVWGLLGITVGVGTWWKRRRTAA